MRVNLVSCVLVVVGLVAAACGTSEDPSTTAGSTSSSTQTSSSGTTSTVLDTLEPFPTGRVKDLTWTTPNVDPEVVGVPVHATTGEDWPVALAFPDAEAPASGWPTIVYFHGSTLGTPFDGLDRLASQGAVVVVPRWISPAWTVTNLHLLTPEEYVDGYWFDVAACALAAAQEVAAEHDGDPDRTTVIGFSAGVHPAGRVALGTARNNLCPDREPAIRPVALVAGDSQWLFQRPDWDETFNDPSSLATDTVDRILNPDRWEALPPSFRAYLWSTESTATARDVDDQPALGSWLTTRLPDDPTLMDDLREVGAFDDGQIAFDDGGLLLTARLEDEGIPVLHEVFPTNHQYAPGVYDRISELVFQESFS